jgi:glyoxylase-like metal-dependent hydrolase (beta-lactamase superfamily II)
MATISKPWVRIVSLIVVLLFAAKIVLFDRAASPEGSYRIDLDALHRAAIADGGPLPSAIEVERIGDFSFPRSLVVAGTGLFQLHPMVSLAHRIVWPDRTVIIDEAVSPKSADVLPGSKLHLPAYERLERANTQAQAIVFTHEHVDHVGAVADAKDFAAIAGKVLITREQLDSPELERKGFAAGTLAHLKPLAYSGLHLVAPGVVLQKAPGHSPGSQLVYVELASGARYLFIGDIAWSEDNIQLQRGRPLLLEWLGHEQRGVVAEQVRALATLPAAVHLVIAHDPVALQRDLAAGLYHEGFSVAP